MKRFGMRASAALISVSLFYSSTAQAAAPIAATSTPAWSTLSFLSGGQNAAAYCGSAAVAAAGAVGAGAANGCVLPAVDATVPPPVLDQAVPPPLPGAASGVSVSSISPLVIALGALAAAAVAYLLIHGLGGDNDNDNSPS